MSTKKRQVLVRIQPESYEKLKFIAEKNYRTVTNLVEWSVLEFIDNYESQHGQIVLGEPTSVESSVVQKSNGGANFLASSGNGSYKLVTH